MNTRLILTYLTELSENNERAWYHAHKKAYQEALAAFDSLLRALISKIRAFDSDIPSCRMLTLYFCESSSNGEMVTSKVTVRVSAILIRPLWGFLYMYCNVTLV